VDEKIYEPMLPRTFEELAVRVFCRDNSKDFSVGQAFKRFCLKFDAPQPFPSQLELSENGNTSQCSPRQSQTQSQNLMQILS
jgi:hypothetical protein